MVLSAMTKLFYGMMFIFYFLVKYFLLRSQMRKKNLIPKIEDFWNTIDAFLSSSQKNSCCSFCNIKHIFIYVHILICFLLNLYFTSHIGRYKIVFWTFTLKFTPRGFLFDAFEIQWILTLHNFCLYLYFDWKFPKKSC